MRRMLAKPCARCGATFQFRPDHINRAKFCSRTCRSTTVANQTADRRGDLQRGRGEGRTYRKRGGRHEHREVAQAKVGRALTSDEIVHHIDHDIHNNHPDNLRVMTRAEHMREHGMGIPGKRPSWMEWRYPR